MKRAVTTTKAHYGIFGTEFLRKSTPQGQRAVYLVDFKTGASVTNCAEDVVKEITRQFPNYRIAYRDSYDNWGELTVQAGEFVRFDPWHEWHPTNADVDEAIAAMDQ